MNSRAHFSVRGRNPDVLTCIANLSNDEVFTPPEFASRMLDTLAEAWAADNVGVSLWASSSVKFLDPFTKSGVFLREITSRLTKGLEDKILRLVGFGAEFDVLHNSAAGQTGGPFARLAATRAVADDQYLKIKPARRFNNRIGCVIFKIFPRRNVPIRKSCKLRQFSLPTVLQRNM